MRDYFKDFDMVQKFTNYIDKSNDMQLVKEYFSDKTLKIPYEFDQLVRIFYGALLWKNILYDSAKKDVMEAKRTCIR